MSADRPCRATAASTAPTASFHPPTRPASAARWPRSTARSSGRWSIRTGRAGGNEPRNRVGASAHLHAIGCSPFLEGGVHRPCVLIGQDPVHAIPHTGAPPRHFDAFHYYRTSVFRKMSEQGSHCRPPPRQRRASQEHLAPPATERRQAAGPKEARAQA